ncbi:protein saf4-like isoform X2 [Gastrolobium bilobum]|uniref:protein saf4-like isoform X2 n=1 Tax=Gastrolobium bilobum TaxID=150636 RepID=UPI002AB1113F|nr:protein saf4-like isoform X2 [Gastrolobium bilobum]
MPFNVWCGGCNSMIAKGVRFNAEKKQVGNYYSTKIWSFTMKSACCKHEIIIQTDPKNCEVKRKELLKKRLLPGKGALAFDCFRLQSKMLSLQQSCVHLPRIICILHV